MKQRILLIVAMLLIASPAMAAITITATQEAVVDGNAVVRVDYSDDGTAGSTKVRGISFDLMVNVGTFADINSFKRGDSNTAEKGYGIFPGKFRDVINPGDACFAVSGYNPICPNSFSDATETGLGKNKIIVEMGSLYVGDANKPDASGTLFRTKVTESCTMTFAANTVRGNVQENGSAAAITTPGATVIYIPPEGCTLPNLVGMTREAARAAIIAANFTGTIVEYNDPGNGDPMRQVIAQNPAPGLYPCDTQVDFNAVSWPVRENSPLFSPIWLNWLHHGRPRCWAFPKHCHGDADGVITGQSRVSGADLAIFRGAFNKAQSAIPAGGYCADFDHVLTGQSWVSGADLTIFKAYFNKAETQVPICGNTHRSSPSDPNFWYWCIPAGETCPSGQYCAPVGICPNDP